MSKTKHSRSDIAGALITDDQKRRAKSPAERRAIRAAQAAEELELNAFLYGLTPDQLDEMEADCNA